MTSPSASVPDLRKRSAMFYVILGGAAALLIGAIVAVVITMNTPSDPAIAACEHVEQQAEMGSPPWDAWMDGLVAVVQERIKSVAENNEPIRIRATGRKDRCTETLRKLKKNMAEPAYAALAKCIGDATTPKRGLRCYELVR
ncbi:MAG: hypothetical protein ABI867_04630 [Kofleriaceae bacterium]